MLGLGCGLCALFAGSDAGPVTGGPRDFLIGVKLPMALATVGLLLAALIAAGITLRAKETPPHNLSRVRLQRKHVESSRRKQDIP